VDKATSIPRPFDAVVVGAGIAGLYMLKRLRDIGVTARVVERGGGVGGAWYWNTWPGARTDSESWYYCYSFSPELLEEWDWKERYASQPEMRAYLEHVAAKFDLYRDGAFRTDIASAIYDVVSTQSNHVLSMRSQPGDGQLS